jgi:hypothetical protein
MPPPSVNLREEEFTNFDVLMQQRRFNAANAFQQKVAQGLVKADAKPNEREGIAPELERQYHVSFVPGAK